MAKRKGKPKDQAKIAINAVNQLKEANKILARMVRRGDQEEKKRDKIEKKLDALEKKSDKLEAKLDKIEKKVDKQEKKEDKIGGKLGKLEAKLDKIEKKIDERGQNPSDDRSFLQQAREELAGIGDLSGLVSQDTARDDLGDALTAVFQTGAANAYDLLVYDLDKKEKALDKLEKDLDKMEKDLDDTEKRLDKSEKTLDGIEKMLDTLEKQLDRLEKQLDGNDESPGGGQSRGGRRTSQIKPKRPSPTRARRPRRAPPKASAKRIQALIETLRGGGPGARDAGDEIEKLGAAATKALLKAYDSPEEHFRWEIVNLLGYTRDPAAIPLLADRGVQDPELHPRWRSIWALTSVDDGSAADRLKRTIAQSKGRRRYWASVALSLFEDRAALPALRQGLRAKASWDRWESASCLVGYADEAAARIILERYDQEPEADVRAEMVKALRGVNAPAPIQFLGERLVDGHAAARSAAVEALAHVDAAVSEPMLRARQAQEPDKAVRKQIQTALSVLGSIN